MKYLRNFDTYSEYKSSKSTLTTPNISFIEELKSCRYKRLQYSEIGDVAIYDQQENEIFFISPDAFTTMYWQELRYEPIGVVAVGTKYTPDHSTRIVSLLNMSLVTPEQGCNVAKPVENDNYMYWGGNGIDIPGLPNKTQTTKVNPLTGETTGLDYWNRIPSDQQFNSTGYIDPLSGCRYYLNNYVNDPNYTAENKEDKFGPYPILKNGKKNPQYYDPASATSDFNGPENTDIIIGMAEGNYANWKTQALVNNFEKGNYPPAFCCRRYKTIGTKSGDWYLPAIGEAMFLSTHYGAINKGLLAISNTRGATTALKIGRDGNFGYWFWSSTEYTSSNARTVLTNYGFVHYNSKSATYTSNRVRAFLRF